MGCGAGKTAEGHDGLLVRCAGSPSFVLIPFVLTQLRATLRPLGHFSPSLPLGVSLAASLDSRFLAPKYGCVPATRDPTAPALQEALYRQKIQLDTARTPPPTPPARMDERTSRRNEAKKASPWSSPSSRPRSPSPHSSPRVPRSTPPLPPPQQSTAYASSSSRAIRAPR